MIERVGKREKETMIESVGRREEQRHVIERVGKKDLVM